MTSGDREITIIYIVRRHLNPEVVWKSDRVHLSGPLFISDKILLSHEPVYGLPWCLNIHGHDHNGMEAYHEGCKHINLAANVCGYTPVNLGKIIKDGVLADIESIHRMTIDRAVEKKQMKEELKE